MTTDPAWLDYMARNRRANTEYRIKPIISAPVCEVCGSNSAKAVCAGCRIEEKP